MDNRFALLSEETRDQQPQKTKKKTNESSPNQPTPAQRAKIIESKKKNRPKRRRLRPRQRFLKKRMMMVGSLRR